MYVTGRNNSGVGTILSSLSQLSKEIEIEKVTVIASSKASSKSVDGAMKRINKILNSKEIMKIIKDDNDLKKIDWIFKNKIK